MLTFDLRGDVIYVIYVKYSLTYVSNFQNDCENDCTFNKFYNQHTHNNYSINTTSCIVYVWLNENGVIKYV